MLENILMQIPIFGIRKIEFNAEIEKMKYKAGDLMWKCPKCGREFKNTNQEHYCG